MVTLMLSCSVMNSWTNFLMIGPSPPVKPFQKVSVTAGPSYPSAPPPPLGAWLPPGTPAEPALQAARPMVAAAPSEVARNPRRVKAARGLFVVIGVSFGRRWWIRRDPGNGTMLGRSGGGAGEWCRCCPGSKWLGGVGKRSGLRLREVRPGTQLRRRTSAGPICTDHRGIGLPVAARRKPTVIELRPSSGTASRDPRHRWGARVVPRGAVGPAPKPDRHGQPLLLKRFYNG